MNTQQKIEMILKLEREQKLSAERKVIDLAEQLVTRLENNLSDLGKSNRAEMIFLSLQEMMISIDRANAERKNSSGRINLLEQIKENSEA